MLNISLLSGGCFRSTKNTERGSLVLHCLIFQMFITVCPNNLNLDFDIVGVDGIVHILKLLCNFLLLLVCRNGILTVFLLGRLQSYCSIQKFWTELLT
jgi:hypothetical protein